jgi:hypothetical protein
VKPPGGWSRRDDIILIGIRRTGVEKKWAKGNGSQGNSMVPRGNMGKGTMSGLMVVGANGDISLMRQEYRVVVAGSGSAQTLN